MWPPTPGPARATSVSPARSKPAVLNVYSRIDGIKVTPQAGMARVGGAVFPKQLQQFEAVAIANGPDGKPDTPTICSLARSTSKWSLEEYTATFDDDDLKFVGTLDPDRAVHAERGRAQSRTGPATATTSATSGSSRSSRRTAARKPLRARAHLLVTVPVYMRWFNAEGTK